MNNGLEYAGVENGNGCCKCTPRRRRLMAVSQLLFVVLITDFEL
jgi:hypothetical protein